MKLKDIVELPEAELQILSTRTLKYQMGWCDGRNELREQIGNLEIELDVEKIKEIVVDEMLEKTRAVTDAVTFSVTVHEFAQAIANNFKSIIKVVER